MAQEDTTLWSVVVRLTPGRHEFCFLVDGQRTVLSTRHDADASSSKPGMTCLNWRNVQGARPAARRRAGAWPLLRAFLGGVGVFSLHDDARGVPSLQGALAFPTQRGAAGGEPELDLVGEEALASKDLVLHARVPILVVYIACVYFACIGAAVLVRNVRLAW